MTTENRRLLPHYCVFSFVITEPILWFLEIYISSLMSSYFKNLFSMFQSREVALFYLNSTVFIFLFGHIGFNK